MADNLPLYNVYNNTIYMCGASKATHYDSLKEESIDAMLFINHETKDKNTLGYYTEAKIQHYCVIAPEESKDCNFRSVFKKCIKIIEHFDSNKKKIVVYCASGETYAPTIITAYIIYKFYVVEKQKSPDNMSIVVSILGRLQKSNRDIDFGQLNVEIRALADYEREKIKERILLDEVRNTKVEEDELSE